MVSNADKDGLFGGFWDVSSVNATSFLMAICSGIYLALFLISIFCHHFIINTNATNGPKNDSTISAMHARDEPGMSCYVFLIFSLFFFFFVLWFSCKQFGGCLYYNPWCFVFVTSRIRSCKDIQKL